MRSNNLQQLLRQAESLLNKGEPTTFPERIDKLRGELFSLQAKVAVLRDTLDDQRTDLDRVCRELDALATQLEAIQVQLASAMVAS